MLSWLLRFLSSKAWWFWSDGLVSCFKIKKTEYFLCYISNTDVLLCYHQALHMTIWIMIQICTFYMNFDSQIVVFLNYFLAWVAISATFSLKDCILMCKIDASTKSGK